MSARSSSRICCRSYAELRQSVRRFAEELAIPLSVFEWEKEMKNAGVSRGAIYLVRPDGYVAVADDGDPVHLGNYWSRRAPLGSL